MEKTLCFKWCKHPATEKLFDSAWLRSARLRLAQGRRFPVPGPVLCHAWDVPAGREAGCAGGSLSLDAFVSEEKEAPVTSASEIQPGIRKREDFPNRCANRGVQYGRVQLNAINQIGLGRICRGPVWKSGLLRFLAAVSQPYVVSQHAVALYAHVGVLGEQPGAPGLGTGETVRGGHGRVVWAVRGHGRTRLDKHQEPDIFLVL